MTPKCAPFPPWDSVNTCVYKITAVIEESTWWDHTKNLNCLLSGWSIALDWGLLGKALAEGSRPWERSGLIIYVSFLLK